jgi:hypothetical protein
MESSMEPELDIRGVVPIENPQKSSHGTPPEGCHGLCLPNPCRAAYLGGVSSGKTNCLICTLGQCHAWRPFKHIYLMSPNNETVRKGEYGVLDDVTCLDHWPTLDYWESRPGRSALIVDDISWSLSKRGSPSQHELADRTCGHISSHHEGGLSIFIAQQTHTGITPNIRRLISHWFLFPRRLSVDSIGHIARSCMLEKQTLRKILDFCDGPYDFMLIENIPVEHRSRARKNGWQNVKGLL